MEHDKVQEWLYGKAKEESEKWFIAQCANHFGYFYLYYTTGDIKISDSHPGEGWHLAMPQRISPAWSKEQAKTICVEALRRCPCLPIEELTVTKEQPAGLVHLQTLGKVQAIPAHQLKPGMVRLYNYGQTAEVVAVEHKGKSVYETVRTDGQDYRSRRNATKLLPVTKESLIMV